MELQIVFWYWLIFGMLLMLAEIALPTFVALWFGAGALVVGVLLWLFPAFPFGWQLVVWALLSAFCTWLWFKYLKPMAVDKTKAGLSREAILGQSGIVVSLPGDKFRGVVRFATPMLGAEEWPFICEQPLILGDRVFVKEVSGNALIVEKR